MAKSTEKLIILAKEKGIELTEEQGKSYFTRLNPPSGELTEDELDNVAGGIGYTEGPMSEGIYPMGYVACS